MCNIHLHFESLIVEYPQNLRGQGYISGFLGCSILTIITDLEQFAYEIRTFNKITNGYDRVNCGMVPFADLRNNEP